MKTLSRSTPLTNTRMPSQAVLIIIFIMSYISMMFGQGMEIDSINALINAIQIEHTQANGINIQSAFRDGFFINSAGDDGVQVGIANDDGISIGIARDDGVFVSSSGGRGLYVDEAGEEGLYIYSAGEAGIFVGTTDGSGLYVEDSGSDGVHIVDAHDDGFEVLESGDDGLHVGYAQGNGIRVGNADEYSMDIQGDKNGPAYVENHIARLYNFNDEGSADVLALKVNGTDDPDHTSNFITFFKGGPDNSLSNALGAIEGNGSGGITFKTNGADFAEVLLQKNPEEQINPGDIVGVYNGQISLNTKGADRIMVITDRPAILGNQSYEDASQLSENVSFIGQVPVRIRGPVQSGEWIIASGINDGTGYALSSDKIGATDKILGQAWATDLDTNIKKVNTLIGLDHSGAHNFIIQNLKKELHLQRTQTSRQQIEIDCLKTQVSKLINQINNLDR